ncbi:MAG TPA: BBE domain-containing protein [Anaerolineales bacterium]|nr:BBE domain-containing protein [Anaerolineales bacterium]
MTKVIAHDWAILQSGIDGKVALPGSPAYYGTNYHRLVQVKAQYDPTGFFRFYQSLPVP